MTWLYSAPRSASQNSGRQAAKTPDTLSAPSKERTTALRPYVGGTLVYLVSLGVVATVTVVALFGLGFYLLAHPNDEPIVGAGERGVETEPQRADLGLPPETDAAALTVQTDPPPAASVRPVPPEPPPEAHGISPPHRHGGARKHWAGVARPGSNGRPPPTAGGLENVGRWIVQSATGILAALSPPPSRPAPGFKTHQRADR
jgi:hypothetical protein